MSQLVIKFNGKLNKEVVDEIYKNLSAYVQEENSNLEQPKQQPRLNQQRRQCIDGACVNCPHYEQCIQNSARLNNFYAGGL